MQKASKHNHFLSLFIISENLCNPWLLFLKNEPNFNPTKIALSPYFIIPNANFLMPVITKNEPKRSQLSQNKKMQNKPILRTRKIAVTPSMLKPNASSLKSDAAKNKPNSKPFMK